MALFLLRSNQTPLALIVRTNCISCVRKLAVEYSPADEFGLWSTKAWSTVTVLRNGYGQHKVTGPQGVVERIEK